MNTEDELLLLAHGIVSLDLSVRVLDDLANLRVSVPHGVLGRLRQHRLSLAQLWWADTHGDPVWQDVYLDRAVAEAQEWVASRMVRLAQLREGKTESDN